MFSHTRNPRILFEWVDQQPGGRFHLHGYNGTEGFSFRFEDPKDATWFRMNLPE